MGPNAPSCAYIMESWLSGALGFRELVGFVGEQDILLF